MDSQMSSNGLQTSLHRGQRGAEDGGVGRDSGDGIVEEMEAPDACCGHWETPH